MRSRVQHGGAVPVVYDAAAVTVRTGTKVPARFVTNGEALDTVRHYDLRSLRGLVSHGFSG